MKSYANQSIPVFHYLDSVLLLHLDDSALVKVDM